MKCPFLKAIKLCPLELELFKAKSKCEYLCGLLVSLFEGRRIRLLESNRK